MYSETLLITGITYEAVKRDTIAHGTAVCDRLGSRLVAFMDEYDKKHYQTTPCDGTILCERQGVRHRKDCQGKVEPIAVFWKKVQTNG